MRVSDSHVRSISKAISWRILGSIDTFVLTLLITGNVIAAGSVASLETLSKIVLYYLHERAWSNIPLGRKGPDAPVQEQRALSIPSAVTASAPPAIPVSPSPVA